MRLAALLVLLAPSLAASQEPDPDDPVLGRLFAIPDTREAKSVAQRGEEHLLAARWGEGLHDLQRLIEDHRGDVLAPGWRGAGTPEAGDAYLGAAAWAANRLLMLPDEALDLYRERHRGESALALERALAQADRRALAGVARRWPVSDAAERAWWALGDLELERGHTGAAARAWERARTLRTLLGLGESTGALARFDVVAALLGERVGAELADWAVLGASGGAQNPLRLPGPGEGGGPVPLAGADRWEATLPPGPFDGHTRRDRYNLFPVRAGDRLLVSTSLRLLCLDAHTGGVLWDSGEAPGWSSLSAAARNELFQGIDLTDSLVSAAAAGGVAVAALQIPWARLPNTDYQGIPITTSIPERRLFAFDLRTGTLLWNHAPVGPLEQWNGDTGTYAETTSVAGAPVIASSRVLVPSYHLEGRVDYHVACYDLATGARLWSTPIVSGQRETNMFGRHEEEFAAPPLRVEGDLVLALSQVGTIAAIDLFTGAVLWQAVYEQVPLPSTHGWETSERRQYWRNAPPVVGDGAVIVAPVDSEDLTAFALDDGRLLWKHPFHRWSSPHHRDASALIGADRDTVYLGGKTLVAVRRPGGLGRAHDAASDPVVEVWRHVLDPEPRFDLHGSPRATMGAEGVLVPTRESLHVLGRADGQPRAGRGLPWTGAEQGNLLAGDGAVFSMSGDRVHGFFDWDVLLARARASLQADPASRANTLDLARLLQRRGETLLEAGELREARKGLREAAALLEPIVPSAGAASDPELASLLHHTLRSEARAAGRLADFEDALELLALALPLAEVEAEVRDTLLEREALLRTGGAEPWLACLGELERRCGGLLLPPEHIRFGPEPTLLVHLSTAEDAGWAADRAAIPIRPWVRLERSYLMGALGEVAAELDDLHAILAEDGEVELFPGVPAYQVAETRIEARLAAGAGDAYSAFEARAQALLDEAARTSSAGGLDQVARRYPHSVAARSARALRLDWASAEGDAATVSALVNSMLTSGPGVTSGDARALLRLGAAMGAIGNRELERALLTWLAESWPNLRSDLAAHGGSTVSEVVGALPAREETAPLSERATFGGELKASYVERDHFALVGDVPPRGDHPARVVVARGDRLEAWDPSAPATSAWSYELPYGVTPDYWLDSTRLAPGRAIVAAIDDVLAIDTATGTTAWTWHAGRYAVHSLEGGDGVIVALMPAEGDRARIQALDVWTGAPLWAVVLDLAGTPRLLVDDGRAVILSSRFHRPVRVTVLDLFRGRVLHELQLEDTLPHDAAAGAWISGDRLVLPSFLASRDATRNRVVGVDLGAGRAVWSLDLGAREELFAVASSSAGTFLLTRPLSPEEAGTGGAISLLDQRSGAVTPVLSLQLGEEVLGIPRGRRTRLDGPHLFLAAHTPGGRTTPITAVRLPHGEHWVHALPVSYEELYHASLPAPAVSSTTVALAYTTVDRTNELERTTRIALLDRRTGRELGNEPLDPGLGEADGLRLLGLGPSLFLVGRRPRGPGQLEVWSPR